MRSSILGELEQQIMDIVWKENRCSARDVLIKLEKDRKLAYTTVATILQRLYDKGLLNRQENKAGHIYSPKISKKEFTNIVAQSFIKKFINSFGDIAISSFANSIDSLSKVRRDYFLKLLDENERNK